MTTAKLSRPEVFTPETALVFLTDFDNATYDGDQNDWNDVHSADLEQALEVLSKATNIPTGWLGERFCYSESDTVESLKLEYADFPDFAEFSN